MENRKLLITRSTLQTSHIMDIPLSLKFDDIYVYIFWFAVISTKKKRNVKPQF